MIYFRLDGDDYFEWIVVEILEEEEWKSGLQIGVLAVMQDREGVVAHGGSLHLSRL